MSIIDYNLHKLAMYSLEKTAVVPPPPADPNAMGGMPPGMPPPGMQAPIDHGMAAGPPPMSSPPMPPPGPAPDMGAMAPAGLPPEIDNAIQQAVLTALGKAGLFDKGSGGGKGKSDDALNMVASKLDNLTNMITGLLGGAGGGMQPPIPPTTSPAEQPKTAHFQLGTGVDNRYLDNWAATLAHQCQQRLLTLPQHGVNQLP